MHHKALPGKERLKGEKENEKNNWLGHGEATNKKRKMVQVPQNQKYVSREPEGQHYQTVHNSTRLPGSTKISQWTSLPAALPTDEMMRE